MNFGLLLPGGDGHLNPMLALIVELQKRGHQVTFFSTQDTAIAAKAAGVDVIECAAQEMPLGTTDRLTKMIAGGTPPWKMSAVMKLVETAYKAYLLAVDDWLTQNPNRLDCLLVDSLSPHLYLLGEKHQIKYILLEPTVPALMSPEVPPLNLGWDYSDTLVGKIRDRIGNALFMRLMGTFLCKVQNQYAAIWQLPASKSMADSRLALARITQVPEFFDFPRSDKDKYIYTSPWVNSGSRIQLDFPWQNLNGKPLIYAAFGTIYNDQKLAYNTIAAACSQIDCQLVLAVGSYISNADLEAFQHNYDQFIFVRKAPQVDLLKRTKLFITHAGMNSTLEALQVGVPMVAMPIGNDQPGVAARIRYHQVGVSIPIKKLKLASLHTAIKTVLNNPIYTENAQAFAKLIQKKSGLIMASEAIERLVATV